MAGIISTGGSVWLDGVKMTSAVKINIEQGWVDCYADSPSRYCNTDIEVDEILMSRFYGFVEFREGVSKPSIEIGNIEFSIGGVDGFKERLSEIEQAFERLSVLLEKINEFEFDIKIKDGK